MWFDQGSYGMFFTLKLRIKVVKKSIIKLSLRLVLQRGTLKRRFDIRGTWEGDSV